MNNPLRYTQEPSEDPAEVEEEQTEQTEEEEMTEETEVEEASEDDSEIQESEDGLDQELENEETEEETNDDDSEELTETEEELVQEIEEKLEEELEEAAEENAEKSAEESTEEKSEGEPEVPRTGGEPRNLDEDEDLDDQIAVEAKDEPTEHTYSVHPMPMLPPNFWFWNPQAAFHPHLVPAQGKEETSSEKNDEEPEQPAREADANTVLV